MAADPKVYALALTYFLLLGATYTMVFSIPSLIKSWGVGDLFYVGLFAAVPQVLGVISTLIGRRSDKHRERRWHYGACVAVAALGLWITTIANGSFVVSMAGLATAGVGFVSATPLLFTTITEYLSKASAAGGIALISSLGNLGPAVAPSVTGYVNASTGSLTFSTYLLIGAYLLSGVLLLVVVQSRETR
jgi:nitrate/nitrite transporter NarK